jgi:hypothetical protein
LSLRIALKLRRSTRGSTSTWVRMCTPFEGSRYVDRFVVRGGKIVQMDVWNDSAGRLLLKNGIEA